MMTEKRNLYDYYQIPAPAGAAGILSCWAAATPRKVSAARQRPAVLVLPGGAYHWTSPREMEPVALRFLARGYAAFALDYSVAPFCFPVALREAALAMRYIREHAGDFGANPRMVAAVGFSAGAHLCGTLGTLYDAPEVSDLGDGALLRPDALGLCYPVAIGWGNTHEMSFETISGGDPELRQRLSLDALVRPDMPPVFLWHTRDDASVPCRNSLVLAAALDEMGVDFALHLYRHGQHGLSTGDAMVFPAHQVPEMSWDVPGWVDSMQKFFEEIGFQMTDREDAQ